MPDDAPNLSREPVLQVERRDYVQLAPEGRSRVQPMRGGSVWDDGDLAGLQQKQPLGMVVAAAERQVDDPLGPVQAHDLRVLRGVTEPARPAVDGAGAVQPGGRPGEDEQVLARHLEVADAEAVEF